MGAGWAPGPHPELGGGDQRSSSADWEGLGLTAASPCWDQGPEEPPGTHPHGQQSAPGAPTLPRRSARHPGLGPARQRNESFRADFLVKQQLGTKANHGVRWPLE